MKEAGKFVVVEGIDGTGKTSLVEALGREISLEDVPDGQARVEEDGSLIIFLEIEGVLSVELSVPLGHWAWRQ